MRAWYTGSDMQMQGSKSDNRHIDIVAAAFSDLSRWDGMRSLAFRDNRTPYRVLVAEFMLQQTQTKTMLPYYEHFLRTWPDVHSLADASRDDVYRAFAGLGYYRRAGFLYETARQIVTRFNGEVPKEQEQLLTLPGIGPYTANAIASIAFGRPVAAVDGNIVRVTARLLRQPYTRNRQQDLKAVRDLMETTFATLPDIHPGDINEALMDLSATICKPKNMRCQDCPIEAHCLACHHGDMRDYPLTPKSAEKPVESFIYLVLSGTGGIYVRKRTESLLKDTFEFIRLPSIADAESLNLTDIKPIGQTRHVFSHKIWQIQFYSAHTSLLHLADETPVITVNSLSYEPVERSELKRLPWSSLFKTVLREIEQD